MVVNQGQGKVMILGDKKAHVEEHDFAFYDVFEDETNEKIFEDVGKELVHTAMAGCNATFFAYGQTGSGKTYTMGEMSKLGTSDEGVAHRMLRELCSSAEEDSAVSGVHYTMHLQYIQIYLEKIYDLLADPHSPSEHHSEHTRKPCVLHDGKRGAIIQGATTVPIHTVDDCMAALRKGSRNLAFASTQMNAHSSRSHAVCRIIIECDGKAFSGRGIKREGAPHKYASAGGQLAPLAGTLRDTHHDGVPDDLSVYHDRSAKAMSQQIASMALQVQSSRAVLTLCDLAGSEDVGRSGATGQALAEAKKINTSLLALGNVIHALTTKHSHVPFRDSILTRMLKDSLGGSAKTSLMVCVSPSDSDTTETIASLRFGSRAKLVKNNVTVNVTFSAEHMHEDSDAMKELTASLQAHLADARMRLEAARLKNQNQAARLIQWLVGQRSRQEMVEKEAAEAAARYAQLLASSEEVNRSLKAGFQKERRKLEAERVKAIGELEEEVHSLKLAYDQERSKLQAAHSQAMVKASDDKLALKAACDHEKHQLELAHRTTVNKLEVQMQDMKAAFEHEKHELQLAEAAAIERLQGEKQALKMALEHEKHELLLAHAAEMEKALEEKLALKATMEREKGELQLAHAADMERMEDEKQALRAAAEHERQALRAAHSAELAETVRVAQELREGHTREKALLQEAAMGEKATLTALHEDNVRVREEQTESLRSQLQQAHADLATASMEKARELGAAEQRWLAQERQGREEQGWLQEAHAKELNERVMMFTREVDQLRTEHAAAIAEAVAKERQAAEAAFERRLANEARAAATAHETALSMAEVKAAEARQLAVHEAVDAAVADTRAELLRSAQVERDAASAAAERRLGAELKAVAASHEAAMSKAASAAVEARMAAMRELEQDLAARHAVELSDQAAKASEAASALTREHERTLAILEQRMTTELASAKAAREAALARAAEWAEEEKAAAIRDAVDAAIASTQQEMAKAAEVERQTAVLEAVNDASLRAQESLSERISEALTHEARAAASEKKQALDTAARVAESERAELQAALNDVLTEMSAVKDELAAAQAELKRTKAELAKASGERDGLIEERRQRAEQLGTMEAHIEAQAALKASAAWQQQLDQFAVKQAEMQAETLAAAKQRESELVQRVEAVQVEAQASVSVVTSELEIARQREAALRMDMQAMAVAHEAALKAAESGAARAAASYESAAVEAERAALALNLAREGEMAQARMEGAYLKQREASLQHEVQAMAANHAASLAQVEQTAHRMAANYDYLSPAYNPLSPPSVRASLSARQMAADLVAARHIGGVTSPAAVPWMHLGMTPLPRSPPSPQPPSLVAAQMAAANRAHAMRAGSDTTFPEARTPPSKPARAASPGSS